ncbi:hypothetical protein IW140_003196 [Coemansia sp. RSA 1813]|nr:hypothetical protein EV178_003120 [Coemansia sp. RSA 1646]KAJ1773954.1 hypothetical protein LPJ74_000053 [Coemansia sp. RSA 1843]KAJ2089326.1 hypothetical protein IW138_003492 [Coemansia sp. RSA 986]KAJ2214429.1 hypothetical protein EV179_002970 [Coemansia sp. RSA 487]KAJ2569349.1 hypothetical protein IW140_003196 [Coemansia sp. RSA 1813]
MVESLGYIAVQPDWTIDVKNALDGAEGTHKFWVSAYKQGCDSIHDNIEAAGSMSAAGGAKLVSLNMASGNSDIIAEYVGPKQLRLSSRVLEIPLSLHTAAAKTVTCSHIARGTGVRSFDISRFGGLLVACGDDGVMDVYETDGGAHRVRLEGHLGDVTCCQFFPSGQVVLSGATDMRLKVWSASDGTNPVTLVGHTATITDTAIVGVGKNVVSAAKDGTVRLWHCGSAALLHTFELSEQPINSIDMVSRLVSDSSSSSRNNNKDQGQQKQQQGRESESETSGKVIATACEDGRALLLNLHTRETIAEFGTIGDPPVRAVAYDAAREIVFAGLSDGTVNAWSAAHPSAPVCAIKRGVSAVSAVRLVRTSSSDPFLCVGSEDGQLFLIAFSLAAGGTVASAEVVEDLVAFDVDPIGQIRVTPSTKKNATRQSVWATGQCSRVCEF